MIYDVLDSYLKLDTERGTVRQNEKDIHLSRGQYALLLYLMEHHEEWVQRDRLIKQEFANSDEALKTSIKRLRKLIGDQGGQNALYNVPRKLDHGIS